MRFLIQRVSRASVRIEGRPEVSIGRGLVVLIGISKTDTRQDAEALSEKLLHLRIFPDETGRMNRSSLDIQAGLLLVSQFALYGDCSRGRRPGFDLAAPPEFAEELYNYAVERMRASGLAVQTGIFRAHMDVELVNDGPVTFLLES
jgi:D-tyrosyl-tRNA(Tyr) deacylase